MMKNSGVTHMIVESEDTSGGNGGNTGKPGDEENQEMKMIIH